MSQKLNPTYFLKQESFRNWALGTDETDCAWWDQWIAEHPQHTATAHMAAAIVAGIQAQGATLSDAEVQVEWHKLKARIESQPIAKKPWLVDWRSIAAIAAVFAGLGILVSWFVFAPQTEEYVTERRVKKNIRLSDGTVINLNSNSKLKTRSTWRFAPAREIWLEGEAYFNVVSHPNDEVLKRFVVHTPGLDVNVVGTEFNVNARNNRTRVFLSEGKVRLTMNESASNHSIELIPGDLITYESGITAPQKIKQKKEPKFIDTWKGGFYTFNRTPLSEVIELVESTHDIKVTLEDSRYLNEPISGKISSSDLHALFNSIANLYQLEYIRKGDEVILSPKKSGSAPPKL